MIEKLLQTAKDSMEKSIDAFQREVARARTGRASLTMLEDVRVDYYGQMVPINQVATLNIPEPRLITIAPWESKIIAEIERAIDKANLGVSPVNDGKVVRLPIPALTEERRKEIVKQLKGHAEDNRISIRHARRDVLDEFKKLEKDGKLPEDESKKLTGQIQKMTDDYIAKIDAIVTKKEAEIMKI